MSAFKGHSIFIGETNSRSSDCKAVPYSKVNPRQARRFAEATGKIAKTDKIDATYVDTPFVQVSFEYSERVIGAVICQASFCGSDMPRAGMD